MNKKSKKKFLFILGILSFIGSVVLLFKSMFVMLNYRMKEYTGALLASEQNLAAIIFAIAVLLVIFATYCTVQSSKIELDAVGSDDKSS